MNAESPDTNPTNPDARTEQPEAVLRRLTPSVQPPLATSLRAMSAEDRAMLDRRLTEVLECVYTPLFQRASFRATLMGPMPVGSPRPRRVQSNDDSGLDLLGGTIPSETLTLTSEQEYFLFMRFNYCRLRVMRIMREYAGNRLTADATRELLNWERMSVQTRNQIVNANLPLVLAMARRSRVIGVEFPDLISEGNLALMRSVDKFDCTRGFKFSTYACRAILKSFSRISGLTARYRGAFPTEFDPALEKSDFLERKRETIEGDFVEELKTILGANAAELNEIEQRVIKARFGLDQANRAEPVPLRTLEQVGNLIGVTKERVRQIQNRAVIKLRTALEDRMDLSWPLVEDKVE